MTLEFIFQNEREKRFVHFADDMITKLHNARAACTVSQPSKMNRARRYAFVPDAATRFADPIAAVPAIPSRVTAPNQPLANQHWKNCQSHSIRESTCIELQLAIKLTVK
jgi:hypothetical protein